MKKLFSLLFCLALLAATAAGCKSPTQTAATATPALTPTKVVTPAPTPLATPGPDASLNEQLAYQMEVAKNTQPTVTFAPDKDVNSVKALYYTGMQYRGKDTRVFAYMGIPASASKEHPVPAVVLIHGGAGRAFPEWVQEWVNRGYAAIAMDTYGNHVENGKWVRDRQGGPNIDNLNTSERALDSQWMYFCLTEATLGSNVLRADERIDSGKIGVMGISWGGLAASILIGYDQRYAFAVPEYGCGYLQESETYFNPIMNSKGSKELWEPSLRLKDVSMPVLWITGGADHSFSINSLQKSKMDTANGQIAIQPNRQHGYLFDVASNREIYRFADSICKGGKPLVTQATAPTAAMGRNVSFTLNVPEDVTQVKVTGYYTQEWLRYNMRSPGSAIQTPFSTFTAEFNAQTATVTATIPEDAVVYYFSIEATAGNMKLLTSSDVVWFGQH